MAFMNLKEMADAYLPMTDDMVVLRLYLSQPEIIEKGVELLTSLLTRELKELTAWKKKQLTDGFYDFSYYYKFYPLEKAARVEMMTRKVIAEVELTENEYQWARENLAGTNPPVFYQPLYKKLIANGVNFEEPLKKEVKKKKSSKPKTQKKKGEEQDVL